MSEQSTIFKYVSYEPETQQPKKYKNNLLPTEQQIIVNENPQNKKMVQVNIYAVLLLILILILLSGFVTIFVINTENDSLQLTPDMIFDNVKYNYHTHCPALYFFQKLHENEELQKLKENNHLLSAYIEQNLDELNKTFIVVALTGVELSPNTTTDQKDLQMRVRYCGIARLNNQTCQQSKFICSNPGPSFDVEAGQQIRVLWVNNYTILPQSKKYLMDNVNKYSGNRCWDTDYELCNKQARTRQFQKVSFYSPTVHNPQYILCDQKQYYIGGDSIYVFSNRTHLPLSPHVHGLQVQPYYDGNPLSWFDNQGFIGPGFYERSNKRTMNYMENPIFRNVLSSTNINLNNSKLNIYKNTQQPGTLWYHDHSMGVTFLNVAIGLHSFYIIRNKTAESQLPTGQYQKIILLTEGTYNKNSYYKSCTQQCKIQQSLQCQDCIRDNQPTHQVQRTQIKINTTYRFRILNGDFRYRYEGVEFLVWKDCDIGDYKDLGGEGDLGGNVYDECYERLKFSVIGADSALRSTPTFNQTYISLSSGQRVDILVTTQVGWSSRQSKKFSQKQFLYVKGKKVQQFLDIYQYVKLAHFQLINQTRNIININKIDVPFVNLTLIPDEQIAVKRMRVLFVTAIDFFYGINFRVRFHQGQSQDPKIGTIQDWYLINSVNIDHPMHVHLVQFQVLQVKALRYITTNFQSKFFKNCSYYLIDGIINQAKQNMQRIKTKENIEIYQNLMRYSQNYTNLQEFCIFILKNFRSQNYTQIFKYSKSQVQRDQNRVSGLNVLQNCTSIQECKRYGYNNGESNQFKYIDLMKDMEEYLLEYQRGWKETFAVPAYAYAKIRIRWTRTDYPQQKMIDPLNPGNSQQACQQKYFNIEQQQLTRYPGYVYHCHMLSHQDRQMMRPIMLKPSGCDRNLQTWDKRWKDQYCEFVNKN